MKTPHPHAFALARAVIDLQRDRPEQPIGGLVNALFVWVRLPMLVPEGEKWRRFLFDTRTGQRTPLRPNQFACLVKRTAVTPGEKALLLGALQIVGRGGRSNA